MELEVSSPFASCNGQKKALPHQTTSSFLGSSSISSGNSFELLAFPSDTGGYQAFERNQLIWNGRRRRLRSTGGGDD